MAAQASAPDHSLHNRFAPAMDVPDEIGTIVTGIGIWSIGPAS
jgi:hypothetical protein